MAPVSRFRRVLAFGLALGAGLSSGPGAVIAAGAADGASPEAPGAARTPFLQSIVMLDTPSGCCEPFLPLETWLEKVSAREDAPEVTLDRSDAHEVLVSVRWSDGRVLGFRVQQAGGRLFLLRYVEDGQLVTPEGAEARQAMGQRFRALSDP
ncbi:hypothetical protein IHV25_01530 [Phaeovibrio sulfidiphilus]|uniref:Lipoprotein n=1 Tax=Phaeovibrio sulfidiphilus TaxID=1220600 RepID=A0A8J6YHD7_9PROT|nr:hypothetical protein [Phaeovibrio sulfidiphilus]MBE1236336.1 hypothetical protein [Phaeovibrio sulfidiphilus]